MTLEEFGLRPEVIAALRKSKWKLDPAQARAGIARLRSLGWDVFPKAEQALLLLWGARFLEPGPGVQHRKINVVVDPIGALAEDEVGAPEIRAVGAFCDAACIPFGQDLVRDGVTKNHKPGLSILILLRDGMLCVLRDRGFLRVAPSVAEGLNQLVLGEDGGSSWETGYWPLVSRRQ